MAAKKEETKTKKTKTKKEETPVFDPSKIDELCQTKSIAISTKLRFGFNEELFLSETVELVADLPELEMRKLKAYKFNQLQMDILKSAHISGLLTVEDYQNRRTKLEQVAQLFNTDKKE